MYSERKFVPMPEAQTPRIRTVAELPFGIEEEVGINVRHVHKMLQLGGMRFLKLASDKNGETSSVNTLIVGSDAEGGAYAGGARINLVPTFSSLENQRYSNDHPRKQARWTDVSVHLNIEEIKQRILRSGGDVREPNNWAGHVNNALKESLQERGLNQLLGNFTRFEKFWLGLVYGESLLYSKLVDFLKLDSLLLNDTFDLMVGLSLNSLVYTLFDSYRYGEENEGYGRRLSLFYGFELDRAICLAALTRFSTLAKKIED